MYIFMPQISLQFSVLLKYFKGDCRFIYSWKMLMSKNLRKNLRVNKKEKKYFKILFLHLSYRINKG